MTNLDYLRIILALLPALLAGCASASRLPQTLRLENQPGVSMPILAWIGPPADQSTVTRYRELRDAGFNVSFSSFPNYNEMRRALDLARDMGVKLMVSCPELQRNPEQIAEQLCSHPAVAGYYLRDEPNSADFPGLADWMRRIQKKDPEHPCYINLFPTYANEAQLGNPSYEQHVNHFLNTVPVTLLSFDHYPVIGTNLRKDYYHNLEVISAAAQKRKIPFWAFVLSVAHKPYPVATIDSLRLQAFTDLAYGAQAIQYFTYWCPTPGQWDFHSAPIGTNGTRSLVYERVKQVNQEIQALAPVFLKSSLEEVCHVGQDIPVGTRRYTPAAPIELIDTSGKGAVVSRLEGVDGFCYVVIVSRELVDSFKLEIRMTKGSNAYQVTKSGHLQLLRSTTFSEIVQPGDIRILAFPPK